MGHAMDGHRSLLMGMVWVWVQIRRKMLGSAYKYPSEGGIGLARLASPCQPPAQPIIGHRLISRLFERPPPLGHLCLTLYLINIIVIVIIIM
jgi:hypothetical protein